MHRPRILFLVFATVIQACTVSRFSNKTNDEDLTISLHDDETFLALENAGQPLARGVKSRGVVTVAMLAQIAGFGAQAVKQVINKEKEKYSASYDDAIYGMYFYSRVSDKNVWDPEGIQFSEFSFLRTFKNKKGQPDTAIFATFVIDTARAFELYNNSTFKIKVKELYIKYAKAKVHTKKWYFPWSYLQKSKNDKLNIDFEIEFTSTYNTAHGNINPDVSLGKFYLLLRDAPLDRSKPEYTKYYNSLKGESLDGSSFIVPRSYGHYYNGSEFVPCFSQGNYNIIIRITESGIDKFVDKLIMDNSDHAIDAINNQIQNLK